MFFSIMKLSAIKSYTPQPSNKDILKTNTHPLFKSFNSYNSKQASNLSLACMDSVGRAQISFCKNSTNCTVEKDALKLVEKILASKDMFLKKHSSEKHIRGGRKIEGFDNLYHDDIKGTCVRGDDGSLNRILLKNVKTNEVEVFDSTGNLIKHYTSAEMNAMHEYKYYPGSFHSRLRYNRPSFEVDEKTFQENVRILDNLFENSEKNYVLDEPKVVYRALQDQLTMEQMSSLMGKNDSIFEELSYSSTTQEFETAKRFKHYSPILEIFLPAGTRYLNLDELFNIDMEHWTEQEYLLPRGSKFQITGYDEEKEVIKASYII